MSEPPRLLDNTNDEFVAGLLRAAQKQAPRRSSVNKTLLAIGTSASVLGGHATAGAAATGAKVLAAPLLKLAAKWTLLGSLAVGTAVTVVELGPSADTHASGTTLASHTGGAAQRLPSLARGIPQGRSLPPRPVPSAEGAVVEATAVDDSAAPTIAASEDLPRATPVAQGTLLQGAVPVRQRPAEQRAAAVQQREVPERRPVAAQAPPREQLEQEVALLDRASHALNNHEFEQAAALADQYLTQFVSGRLEPEARYLKMQAQRGMGDRSGASDEARRLLQVSPNGPHARAAREMQRE